MRRYAHRAQVITQVLDAHFSGRSKRKSERERKRVSTKVMRESRGHV